MENMGKNLVKDLDKRYHQKEMKTGKSPLADVEHFLIVIDYPYYIFLIFSSPLIPVLGRFFSLGGGKKINSYIFLPKTAAR